MSPKTAASSKRDRGRPELSAEERADSIVKVRLRAADHDRWFEAAQHGPGKRGKNGKKKLGPFVKMAVEYFISVTQPEKK
jgi:hypothetical protein